jgi:hypothetical protein
MTCSDLTGNVKVVKHHLAITMVLLAPWRKATPKPTTTVGNPSQLNRTKM